MTLGKEPGATPDPVTALQMKAITDTLWQKILLGDTKQSHEWFAIINLVLARGEDEKGPLLDLLQKLSTKNPSDSTNWLFALEAMLRKEKPFPAIEIKKPIWLTTPVAEINFRTDHFVNHKQSLFRDFTVEPIAKELLDKILIGGLKERSYKIIAVRPYDVGLSERVPIGEFIDQVVKEYNIDKCPPELVVDLRIFHSLQQKVGESAIVGMDYLYPKTMEEKDVFRLDNYTAAIKKAKRISIEKLSVAGVKIDKKAGPKDIFYFVQASNVLY